MMPSILLIDDLRSHVKFLNDFLSYVGYDVLTAYNAADGLEMARQHEPALILLDIRMPGMDGIAFVQTLRRDSRFCQTPVIALTASAMNGDRE
ncbi:MAG: response regulator, partial [Chloroflexi bacterium]|nr:response regulator [Chloroflexota bacterium]